MPRERIDMSLGEVLDFLRGERRLVLGTLDADGTPWADAAPCSLQSEVLYFSIPRDSRSFANIQRDDRVCCSLDRYPTYYEIKGATLHGHAVAVNDAATLDKIVFDQSARGDAAMFGVGLDDVVSFDFAKLKNRP